MSQAIGVFSQSFRNCSPSSTQQYSQHFLQAKDRLWRALDEETAATVSSLFTEASRALDPKTSRAVADSYCARLALTGKFVDSALGSAESTAVSPSSDKIKRTLSAGTTVTDRSSALTLDREDSGIADDVKQEIRSVLDKQYPPKNSYFSFLNFFPSKTSRQVKKIRTLLAQPECDAVVLQGCLCTLSCDEARQRLLQARQAAMAPTLPHLVAPLQDGIQRVQAEEAAAQQAVQEQLEQQQTKRAQRLVDLVQRVFSKETTLDLKVAQQYLEKAQQYLEEHQDKKTTVPVHWDTVMILALWDCFVTLLEKEHPSRLLKIHRINVQLMEFFSQEKNDDYARVLRLDKAQTSIRRANVNFNSFYTDALSDGSWAQELLNITSVKKLSSPQALHQALRAKFSWYMPTSYSVEIKKLYDITFEIKAKLYAKIASYFIGIFPPTTATDSFSSLITSQIVQDIAQVKATYPQFAGDDEKNNMTLIALGLWRVVGNNAFSTVSLEQEERAAVERRMVDALQLPTQPNIDALIKGFIDLQVKYCESWSQETGASFKALKEKMVKMLPPLLEEQPLLSSASLKKSRSSDASCFFSRSSDAAASKESTSSSLPTSTDESDDYSGYQDSLSSFKEFNPLRAPCVTSKTLKVA